MHLDIKELIDDIDNNKTNNKVVTLVCDKCGVTFTRLSKHINKDKPNYHNLQCLYNSFPYS